MSIGRPERAAIGRWPIAVFAVSLALIAVLAALTPTPAHAAGDSDVRVLASPPFSDGYYGWRRTPTFLSLVPQAPGTLYYSWDSLIGGWTQVDGVVAVPEGSHILYVSLVDDEGGVSDRPMFSERFKADYDSAAPRSIAAFSASYVGSSTVAGTIRVSVTIEPLLGLEMMRVGGRDRYVVSAGTSRENFESADTVIIASGTAFADALAASALAGCTDGPILLTRASALPSEIVSEIRRLGAKKAIVVGGTTSVNNSVEWQLVYLGLSVKRLGGRDRYVTAALIAEEVLKFGKHGGRVFVARGDLYPDALALSPLAYRAKAPLLLTRPGVLPAETLAVMARHRFSRATVAGGNMSVTPTVFRQIDAVCGTTVRLAGPTRYETAVAVAAKGVSSGLCSYASIGIATGVKHPDALCGGVAQGRLGGIILLTKPDELPLATQRALEGIVSSVHYAQIYGGPASVTQPVYDKIGNILR
ncbi:MAG: cell wall-binding repeat-containing protein [Actinomycetota bacterium]|nr:cell wall-binding repeat-containing protein [Actinomycetota bacterium]